MAEYNIKVSKVSKQKKKQRATKKRKEFSKVVVILDTIIFIAIIIFSCKIMWKTEDTSALAYLIPSVFSLWAVCNGFYFWKARKENEIKLLQEYKTDAEKALNIKEDTVPRDDAIIDDSNFENNFGENTDYSQNCNNMYRDC